MADAIREIKDQIGDLSDKVDRKVSSLTECFGKLESRVSLIFGGLAVLNVIVPIVVYLMGKK